MEGTNEMVRRLIEMTDETVSAKDIAPIIRMNPSVIVKYAKDGTWDRDRNGDFIISGEGPNAHVKFKRLDFLRKWGFLEPEPEKEDPTDEILKMLGNLLEGQSTIMRALQLILNDQMNEKTASCCNN
jgi:hypothetical protein